MNDQQLPPKPEIVDGTGRLDSSVYSAFLNPDVGVELSMQAKEDGSYRTSILRLGYSMRCVDIYAGRDQMERLHRLIGEHLQQLDQYETDLGIHHATHAERGKEEQP